MSTNPIKPPSQAALDAALAFLQRHLDNTIEPRFSCINPALAKLLDAFAAQAVEQAFCKDTFGSKGCALRAGHTCAHTSMSGSCWGYPVQRAIEKEVCGDVPLTSEEFRDALTRIAKLAATEAAQLAAPIPTREVHVRRQANGRANHIERVVAKVLGEVGGE